MDDPKAGGPWWSRTIVTIAVQQMSHRPPLPKRWIVYCVLAYLAPIIALGALPQETMGNLREVSWLTTLAPAFILSLHSWKPLLNVNGACRPEAEAIASRTGYIIEESIGYPTPGCLGTYTGLERAIPTLTYEI